MKINQVHRDTEIFNFDEAIVPKTTVPQTNQASKRSLENEELFDYHEDLSYSEALNTPRYLLCVPKSMRNEPIYSHTDYIKLFNKKRFADLDLDRILIACYESGDITDVIFASSMQLKVKRNKRILPLFNRSVDPEEIRDFVEYMYGPDSYQSVLDPNTDDLDEAYNIATKTYQLRYRVNICSYQTPTLQRGVKITFRNLPTVIPTFDSLKVPAFIQENCTPRSGLVVIAGETGSGKTTLCASIIHALNERENDPRVILTYEHPPEYLLSSLPGPNPVFQHAVGRFQDFKTFDAGLRNALRCTPEVIYSGESRDKETFLILPRIAESGHMGLTTTHAKSIANIFTRIANEITATQTERIIRMFINYAHLFVVQYLAMSVDGGVVPVQEWLLFTPALKRELLSKPVGTDFVFEIEQATQKHGRTLEQHGKELFEEGKITEDIYHMIKLSG